MPGIGKGLEPMVEGVLRQGGNEVKQTGERTEREPKRGTCLRSTKERIQRGGDRTFGHLHVFSIRLGSSRYEETEARREKRINGRQGRGQGQGRGVRNCEK